MSREAAAIVFYRRRMKLSVNKIAMILERSTRTVQRVLVKNAWVHRRFDNRKLPDMVKVRGQQWFRAKLRLLQWCAYAFLAGLRDDIEVLLGEEPP